MRAIGRLGRAYASAREARTSEKGPLALRPAPVPPRVFARWRARSRLAGRGDAEGHGFESPSAGLFIWACVGFPRLAGSLLETAENESADSHGGGHDETETSADEYEGDHPVGGRVDRDR